MCNICCSIISSTKKLIPKNVFNIIFMVINYIIAQIKSPKLNERILESICKKYLSISCLVFGIKSINRILNSYFWLMDWWIDWYCLIVWWDLRLCKPAWMWRWEDVLRWLLHDRSQREDRLSGASVWYPGSGKEHQEGLH